MLRNPSRLGSAHARIDLRPTEKQIGMIRKVNQSNFEVQSIASKS